VFTGSSLAGFRQMSHPFLLQRPPGARPRLLLWTL
jgi:hypothetical protein